MGEKCDLPCWEIMNCDEAKECPARTRPDLPCWEIAGGANDYRYVMEICTDCIVRLLNGESAVLSKNEIRALMDYKVNCLLARDVCLKPY